MDDNPYESPNAAEAQAEPKKARVMWKDRVWAAVFGVFAFAYCFWLWVLCLWIVSENNPSVLAAMQQVGERPVIGPLVAYGVVFTPGVVAGVMTFRWFLRADEGQPRIGAACLIGSGAAILALYLVVGWLFS